MKLAVIGGGSTYTPELADGIGRLLPEVEELVLVDPDPDRLAVVGPVSARIMAAHDHPAGCAGPATSTKARTARTRSCSSSGSAARPPASATRPGRWTAAASGRKPPGPAGWPRLSAPYPLFSIWPNGRAVGLRPPPSSSTSPTRSASSPGPCSTAGHRAVGLCNVAIGFQRDFASLLGVEPGRVSLGHVGLNHLTWERSVLVDGMDVLPELLAKHAEDIAPHTGLPADFIRHLGMVPSYYLRYYYAHDAVVESLRGAVTRAEEVARLEAELLELYADPALDTKPPQLAQRGGAWYSEAAVDLLASLTGDRRDVQVVNTFNRGTLPFLPDDAVIEVPAVIGAGGAVPVPVAPVEPLLRGLIAHVYAYEELALDAALRGGRDRVYDALLAHPLVGQADQAQCLTDRLLAENAKFLSWA